MQLLQTVNYASYLQPPYVPMCTVNLRCMYSEHTKAGVLVCIFTEVSQYVQHKIYFEIAVHSIAAKCCAGM